MPGPHELLGCTTNTFGGHNECAATFLMAPADNNKLLLALNESH